ncbi:hypothetical protein TPHA_0B03920 [Tetrapisispora phaffii CBS 4417]|uniref:Uncharacterized protein n=1 Tax=Tetrapisispora phaffii (strain ATCC 24235 / CBS 4417 / NBRC 1672 / NRRL Y-8282 / UCD 70-5) TaxID=1071381 RepID=G8BPY3_TETPH|nr:hypothetical protein TPHA_0B03920 [Tetrapisispora phaffii CBS 4417]CCE62064.1 hypothetical protein TPHA_0B03920 [Tetrapisispora phaffii CBS 4417]
MSTKKSVFSRWNKTAILDLIEKLKVNDIPYSLKKTELIGLLENHLKTLDTPLDDVLEYPELVEFYSNQKHDGKELKKEEDDSASLDDSNEANRSKMSNFIDFTRLLPKKTADDEGIHSQEDEEYVYRSDEDLEDEDALDADELQSELDDLLAMEEHTPLQRIVLKLQQWNENVQDYLSTVYSIAFILHLVEFTIFFKYLLSHYPACDDLDVKENLMIVVPNILLWFTVAIAIPCLVSYYFNFIRYDLPSMEFDPMIFSVVKIGFAYTLSGHSQALQIPKSLCHYEELRTFAELYKDALGQLPLFIGLVGCVLTLYIF